MEKFNKLRHVVEFDYTHRASFPMTRVIKTDNHWERSRCTKPRHISLIPQSVYCITLYQFKRDAIRHGIVLL